MQSFFKVTLCLYFLLPTFIAASEQNKKDLIAHFFKIIQTNNTKELQTILNNPKQFSQSYNLNYTAEEICNLPDTNNQMSLHIAAMYAKVTSTTAKFLIKAGANPNAQTKLGLAPLHFPQNNAVARILIQYGAQLSIQDHLGETPLTQGGFFSSRKANEIRTIMFKYGAQYQQNYAEQIQDQQKMITEKIDRLKIQQFLENLKTSATTNINQHTIQKDVIAIAKALEKAQSKNKKFSEQDLYNRYVQQIFKTTDPVALTAINRRIDVIKARTKL